MPIVEVLPLDLVPRFDKKKASTPREVLAKKLGWLSEAWEQKPVFLDLHQLPGNLRIDGRHPWKQVTVICAGLGIRGVPVVVVGDAPTSLQAARRAQETLGNGVCLRVQSEYLHPSRLNVGLRDCLRLLGTQPEESDLIIDYGAAVSSLPSFMELSGLVPHARTWRRFVILSGAFPPNLTNFAVGTHTIQRREWLHWRENVMRPHSGMRIPLFGDYTIQCATYSEPPPGANPSASIGMLLTLIGLCSAARGSVIREVLDTSST